MNTSELREKALEKITEVASQLLKIPAANIETDKELGSYGFDSISMTKFSNQLNSYYGLDLMPTIFSTTRR